MYVGKNIVAFKHSLNTLNEANVGSYVLHSSGCDRGPCLLHWAELVLYFGSRVIFRKWICTVAHAGIEEGKLC